ncbi:hypothetical protein [Paenibacillus paeoniae]|uniref:Uncharacterized protein n=1 Tax=Paenibacillus paeoniae TaxID=2292705 RepID=A0A371PHB6_9BACL|nr:hypothetical protein [Paenibacillus paeoniae]REK75620.1 hypothetical protein DX130_00570 [Paenibacillus paeoniae]
MTVYSRSIHGIERTNHYTKLQPVNRYAAYRLTAFERAPVVHRENWSRLYSDAAGSAAEWLKKSQDAQRRLDLMLEELGRDAGIRNGSFVRLQIQELTKLLNELEGSYRSHKNQLKPEVWEAVELALRHPAMAALGIERGPDDAFRWRGTGVDSAMTEVGRGQESRMAATRRYSKDAALITPPEKIASMEDSDKLRRLLLGADGLIQDIKKSLSFAEQGNAIDLLRLPFTAAYPYALYYGAMQTYWPLPLRGVILNKYY